MITALLVIMIVVMLSMIAVQLSEHNMNGSAGDRKRVQAVHAAEGGLDYAFRQLQAGVLQASYPATGTMTLASSPTTESFSVTATYYATYPPSGAPLVTPFTGAAAVELASTGTTNYPGSGSRLMRALVRLRVPATTSAFVDAVYSGGTITANNGMTIDYGTSGQQANIYTNANDSCTNNMTVQGHLYANGTLTWTNACHVTADVIALGNVTAISNNSTISGNLTSATGSISGMSGTVTGYEKAAGSISSGGTHGPLYPNTPTAFPSESLPTYNWNPSDWTSAGFVEQDFTSCTSAATFLQGLATSTTKYVLRIPVATCGLSLSGTYSLKRDVAIIADGGLNSSSSFAVTNTDTTSHIFYVIVPSNASPAPACGASKGDIQANNRITFTNMTSFFYTPCNVNITNNVGMSGQLYAGGTMTLTNGFTMVFAPASIPGASASSFAYNVDVAYIREEVR